MRATFAEGPHWARQTILLFNYLCFHVLKRIAFSLKKCDDNS